jgi:integrase
VALLIDAPVGEETDIEALSRDEACRILAAAAKRRNGARWSVALAVGIRQSEAIGLRWKYVNLAAGTIEVGWQLRRTRYRTAAKTPPLAARDGTRSHARPAAPGTGTGAAAPTAAPSGGTAAPS